jgi:hypothetical protein
MENKREFVGEQLDMVGGLPQGGEPAEQKKAIERPDLPVSIETKREDVLKELETLRAEMEHCPQCDRGDFCGRHTKIYKKLPGKNQGTDQAA